MNNSKFYLREKIKYLKNGILKKNYGTNPVSAEIVGFLS